MHGWSIVTALPAVTFCLPAVSQGVRNPGRDTDVPPESHRDLAPPRERRGCMPQWTLFEKDFRAIDQVLYDLLERTNALSVHLVDRSGQLITSAGRTADFDPVAFASLIAADFTANSELARLL